MLRTFQMALVWGFSCNVLLTFSRQKTLIRAAGSVSAVGSPSLLAFVSSKVRFPSISLIVNYC